MTRYRDDFDFPVAFPEHVVENTLAEVLSAHGIRQLHSAETEKYAHVTYFLDGGREQPFAGEERILVDSPRDVPSYDHKPQMSAPEVAERVVGRSRQDGYGFVVVNFANPDMVGHTGVIPAVVEAVETTDECLGRVVDAVERAGGVSLVIADHGNAETLLQEDGSPHTAHTTNPVPVILTARMRALRNGELSDVAPTILALLGLDGSSEMSGKNLVQIRVNFRSILPPHCRCPSLTTAYCGRRSGAMNELSRSSSARIRFRSTTTCCAWSATARSPRI